MTKIKEKKFDASLPKGWTADLNIVTLECIDRMDAVKIGVKKFKDMHSRI